MDHPIGVVILDDEDHIIQLLKALIPWESYGLVFLGSAQNGIDGKALIIKEKPDIVFTDIKMPGMNGLEMISSLSAVMKDTSFVIVSGYGQFDYAKKAIAYGVEDYLLKPIDQGELYAVIKKLAGKVDSRHNLHVMITENDQSRKDRSLQEEIEQGARVSIPEGESAYLVVLLCDSSDGSIPVEVAHVVTEKVRLLLHRYPEIEGVVHEGRADVFSLSLPEEGQVAITGLLNSILEDVTQIREVCPSLSFTLFYTRSHGDFASDYSLLSSSFPLRRESPHRKVIMAQAPVLDDLSRIISSWDALCGKIADSLDVESLGSLIVSLEEEERKLDAVNGERLLLQAGKRLAVKLEERKENGLEWYGKSLEPSLLLADTYEELNGRFASSARSFVLSIAEKRAQDVVRPVRQALEYMQSHYMDSDMSLDTVSAVVGLTSPYFSGLFKKECDGQGFQDALVAMRIDRAKELLKSSNDTIARIANEVGYTDVKYFTKLFRKLTGIKPNDFRSLYG
jgi:two-component system response regulator YesN